MSPDLIIVLALLAATIVMFALNRPRMDVVALIMMTVLPLTGVISVPESLAGLSDPNSTHPARTAATDGSLRDLASYLPRKASTPS
ncbi:hypothetical protein [Sphingobium sp. D43FB]|uniref:hypothetical protein n=1 Tax=Sphingobium sp. D43FB TaxID=2017595 RepID=UPI000BB5503B|nr:hypothetical protein [Sphingobium sp. D43FB]PBN41395.1 hypothetical protein SxD43FB_21995 [Sphingobium sp. D43FB]